MSKKGLEYFQRIQEEQMLKQLSKSDLKEKIRKEYKEDVPAHSPKASLIKYILDKIFGKDE